MSQVDEHDTRKDVDIEPHRDLGLREGEPMPEGEERPPPGVHTMAVIRWALVALMSVIAGASIGYYFGAFQKAGASESVTQYYCPMHPSVVQDHPGECPICGMTLVPKEVGAKKQNKPPVAYSHQDRGREASRGSNEAVPGLSEVTLTPERIQLMGMKTAVVAKEKLIPELRTVGTVTANEEGLAQIHTRFSGWIEQLHVSQTGQRVANGQVLATVYSPELLTAQQELLNAQKWTDRDRHVSQADLSSAGLAEDSRRRLELLGISRREIEALVRTRKPKRAIEIRSPVEGYITRKNALQGLYVQPGTELFEVADLSKVWVLADVYEYELDRVRVGTAAKLELAAYRGQTFRGRVEFIYPTVDTDSRTLRVRLELKNPGLKLRPGMYGDVVVELPAAEGLVVPAEAIVDTGEIQYVFLALEGGRFSPRRVKVGAESNGKVEVLEGVAAGEVVVTTANFLIDSESRLHAAISGQLNGEGSARPAAGPGQGANCETEIDKRKFPEKHQQCRACEVQHRGMGTMEEDCKAAIAKPWK